MDEIDRGGRERKIEGRDGEISFASYSIEAAQLGLRRHTSEKGKHAEALGFMEGEEDVTLPKLQIKVGICTLPRFSFKLSTTAAPQSQITFFILFERERGREKNKIAIDAQPQEHPQFKAPYLDPYIFQKSYF